MADAQSPPPDPVRRRIVSAADAGRRVDDVVAEMLGVGRRAAVRLLDQVRLDGRRVRKGDRVAPGGEILLPELRPGEIAVAAPDPDPGEPGPVVRRATADVFVVDKPAGLPSVAIAGRGGESLAAWAARLDPACAGVGRPGESGLAHRLDGGTSGLVLVARNGPAWSALREQFSRREVEKTYLALVCGWVREPLEIDVAVGRHPKSRRRMLAVSGSRDPARYAAQPALTRVEPLERVGRHTLVRARTSSGARHQVRVHLAHAGHPLADDVLYGGEAAPGLDGFLLHACALRWREPAGPESFDESPPPERWRGILGRLRDAG